MSFKPLKGSCPICGGVSRGRKRGGGDCRENTANEVVHCRTGLELGAPAGWKFVSLDAHGFGMYVEERDEDPIAEQQRWEENRKRAEAARLRKLAEYKESLSLDERNAEFRKLIAQGAPYLADIEDLKKRGLDPIQHINGKFITIDKKRTKFQGIDPRLPGIAGGAKQYLAVAGDGYLCPAWDVRGRIIGAQIRLREESSGGKYRWLKSKFSSNLPNGELPITVCRSRAKLPSNVLNRPTDIGLIEALLKPYIAANLSGRTFIGASGGNFLGSPEQLGESLDVLSEELGTKQVTLFPDAGAVSNTQVYNRDCKTIKEIRKWGYEVRVADWGQLFSKENPDYDELLAAGHGDEFLSYLSADEYLKLGQRQGKPKNRAAEDVFKKIKSIDRFVTQTRNERYLTIQPQEIPEGIVGILSAMQTGKTELLKLLREVYLEANVLSYRNSLLMNTANRIPGVNYLWDLVTDDPRATKILWSCSPWVLACIDSIGKLAPRDVLIIEEAGKVFPHALIGKTCRRNRRTILKQFERFVKEAKTIILLDADLKGQDLEYLRSISGGKEVYCIQNLYKPQSWNVYFHEGAIGENGLKVNCKNPLEGKIIEAIEAGLKPLIASDSQRWLEGLCNRLSGLFPGKKHLRVDSHTKTDDSRVGEFLTSPNEWLEQARPDWVAFSPTAESSLDITTPHFDIMFANFAGAVTHESAKQMLGRYRQPVDRVVFCRQSGFKADDGSSDSFFPGQIAKDLLRTHRQTVEQIALERYLSQHNRRIPNDADSTITLLDALKGLLDPSTGEWTDPHLKAMCKYKAYENYSKAHIREMLKESLVESGHKVISVIEPDLKTGVSRACDEVLRSRAGRMANAQDISVLEAREILQNMEATSQKRFEAQKALLKERVPGVELTPDFIYNNVLKNKTLNAMLVRWMIQNPEVQFQLDREKWIYSLEHGSMLWDINTHSLRVSVLRELGVHEFLDRAEEWSNNDPKVIAVMEKALAIASRVNLALNIKVHEDYEPCKFLHNCLKKMGVKVKPVKRRKEGGRVRCYSPLPLNTDGESILEAYDLRFASYLDSQVGQIEPLENSTIAQCVPPPEVLEPQEEPGTLAPSGYGESPEKPAPTYRLDSYGEIYEGCTLVEHSEKLKRWEFRTKDGTTFFTFCESDFQKEPEPEPLRPYESLPSFARRQFDTLKEVICSILLPDLGWNEKEVNHHLTNEYSAPGIDWLTYEQLDQFGMFLNRLPVPS